MIGKLKAALRAGGVLVVATIVLAGVAEAQEAPRAEAPECVVKVQPERLSVRSEPQHLSAAYPENIGKVLSALIDEASGIKVVEVVEVAPNPDDPAPSSMVRVSLDLSAAVAGEWTLSFQGESGKCTAKVTVQAAETPNL